LRKMMTDFDFGFDNMITDRFDRQFSSFDRLFDNLRKVQMELDATVGDLKKDMECDLKKDMECDKSQPDIKFGGVTTTPEHHRYDFKLTNASAENVDVNAYEDRYSGSCYLNVCFRDNKASDKTYEYTISPEGKVLEKKLLSSEEMKLLNNGSQDQQKQLEGTAATSKAGANTNGNASTGTAGDANSTKAVEDSSKKNRKHYVQCRSSGGKMNTMSYRLPEDVSERELMDIKTEHSSTPEGGSVLSLYIPRPNHKVHHRWVNGTKVLHIPVRNSA